MYSTYLGIIKNIGTKSIKTLAKSVQILTRNKENYLRLRVVSNLLQTDITKMTDIMATINIH